MSRVEIREVSREQLSMWEYHVLMALGGGDRHADQLVRDIERLSARNLCLDLRVVEALLRRLGRAGFVAVVRQRAGGDGDAGADDEHVHYALTRPGEQRLAEETRELASILAGTRVDPHRDLTLE